VTLTGSLKTSVQMVHTRYLEISVGLANLRLTTTVFILLSIIIKLTKMSLGNALVAVPMVGDILSSMYYYMNIALFYMFCTALWQNYFFSDVEQGDSLSLCLGAAFTEIENAGSV
jgi:hypothetical protein